MPELPPTIGEPTTPEEYIAQETFKRVDYFHLKNRKNGPHIRETIKKRKGHIPTSGLRRQLKNRSGYSPEIRAFIGRAGKELNRILDEYEAPPKSPYDTDPTYDKSGQGMLPFGEALSRILGI